MTLVLKAEKQKSVLALFSPLFTTLETRRKFGQVNLTVTRSRGKKGQFATSGTRRKLGRVNFRKDVWDCHWGQSNWPIADWRVPINDPRGLCES